MYSRHRFPNQNPNEHVLMFLRRHWIVPLRIILVNVFFAAIPAIIYIILVNYSNYLEQAVYWAFIVLLFSAFYLFIVLFAFSNFVDYFLDTWLVTNQRIISVEQHGLFARIISEKDLGQMQDITAETEGFWPTVLNYGDVYIQTAGEKERFVFRQVPFAEDVAQRISNLVQEYQKINQHIPAGNL